MDLSTGTRLGPYEIVGLLGAGGMGVVYRARDTRLKRDVAVKVLPANLASDPDRVRRFEHEALTVAALSHPNVVAVYDVGTHEGVPYLVSELLEGRTLRDELATGPLPIRRAVDTAVLVAKGLAAAHGKGIVHRDLKPANVFVTADGQVKILDFGLAKLTLPEAGSETTTVTRGPATEAGAVMGTTGYMAPEQVRGLPCDQRSDIFAFGCVLYEMLSGQRAFKGESQADTLAAILNAEPPTLSGAPHAVPAALQQFLDRCLAKRPDGRFSSAHDLGLALEALSAPPGLLTPVAPGPVRRRFRPTPRATIVLLAGALALVATAVALVPPVRQQYGEPRSASSRATQPGGDAARPAKLVVAVLPFRFLGNANFSYLADAASEEVRNSLSRAPGLEGVVRSESSRKAVDSPTGSSSVAEALGADRLVEGTVFYDGKRLRLAASLTDGEGTRLWTSENIYGTPEDVLDLSATLATLALGQLGVQLPLEKRGQGRKIDPEAIREVIRVGSSRYATSTDPAEALQAIQDLRRILEREPEYVDAHRLMADILSNRLYQGGTETPPLDALRQAREHAERAVQLAPSDGLARLSRATVKFVGGDRAGAEADFREAMELSPGNGEILRIYSWFLGHFEPFDACLGPADRAEQLDPLVPSNASAWCLFGVSRFREAAERLEKRYVGRGGTEPHALLAAAYARTGRLREAVALRDRVRKVTPARADAALDWFLIYVDLVEGDLPGARKTAEFWWSRPDNTVHTWGLIAQIFGAIYESSPAEDVRERAVQSWVNAANLCGRPVPCYADWTDTLRNDLFCPKDVRQDPRIQALLQKAAAGKQ